MNHHRIPRWSKLALAAAALAMPLVACGDDDDADEGVEDIEEGVDQVEEGADEVEEAVEDEAEEELNEELEEEMADTEG